MAKKKKEPEQEVQAIDLTDLVNYVNELGLGLEELKLKLNTVSVSKFYGIECVDTEGQLGDSKYFHYLDPYFIVSNSISKEIKDFYISKYGAIPQIQSVDLINGF